MKTGGQYCRYNLIAFLGQRELSCRILAASQTKSADRPVELPFRTKVRPDFTVREERFLILTDPIAQTWMDRKAGDLERWLGGMRRLQAQMEAGPPSDA